MALIKPLIFYWQGFQLSISHAAIKNLEKIENNCWHSTTFLPSQTSHWMRQ
ncbi:MAG: hypothetical protein ACTS73_00410 [Arsenophonus sp. NEOnobi-MAG3]